MAEKQGLIKISDIRPIPFRGGSHTAIERALIPHGQFSLVQNMRPQHPGFEQRKGFARKHTRQEGNNKCLSLYQFCKGERTERHFYAQWANSNIDKATNEPPTVTTGAFGSGAFGGSTDPIPASWANSNDICLMANGVDQHQICAGTANYVSRFVKFAGSAAPAIVPKEGLDYTQEVTDGNTTTHAVLDSLNTFANHNCIFICTPLPANKLTWTFVSGHENATAAVGTLKYRKNDNTWADTGETDGTTSSGATLGQNGSMTWSQATDEVPYYAYGMCGFWYRWETATQLDAEVEVSSVTYGTDGVTAKSFQNLVNVWSGWPPYAIEARFQQDTGDPFETFGTDTVEIDSMTTNGKVYFNSYDPALAMYIDPGETPNTTASTTIDAVYYWNGTAWTAFSSVTDGTAGMSKAGWVTWGRAGTTFLEQPRQFDTSRYYSYWYYFETDQNLSDKVIISIETMPYFDINEAGRIGYVNAAWKGRAVYNFGDQYGFVSAKNQPLVLNGDDYGMLEAGDGRTNRWACARQFHNELLVWQIEKGKEGGTLTLFEGDQPKNFGKLLLSSRLGTMNNKSAVVVDGVLTSTRTDEVVKTLAFWVSRYGTCVTDGRTCSIFSDDIANYFDPNKDECIRRGCENEHWLEHDSSTNSLCFGLVSGVAMMSSTATSTETYKLNDIAGAFETRKTATGHPITHLIGRGDTVYNTTDGTTALITGVDGPTKITLDTDIMASGESYEIYSAVPNLFPVFDLVDKTWSFDVRGQDMSCMAEIEGASGNLPVLLYAGGTDNGTIYRINTGSDDLDRDAATAAIDAYARLELNQGGLWMLLRKLLLMMKTQSAGNCTVTPYRNNRVGTAANLSMLVENTGDAARKHITGITAQDINISLKFQNNTAGQTLYLLSWGAELYLKEGH